MQNELAFALHQDDNIQEGPQMFIQATPLKTFSGTYVPGDMKPTVWFAQAVNRARSTRQSLTQVLLAACTNDALKWIEYIQNRNIQAQSQLRSIQKGVLIIDAFQNITDLQNNSVETITAYDDDEIAESFGTQFLKYMQDEVETAKLFMLTGQCKQTTKQNLEAFIVTFNTCLLEAEIHPLKDADNLQLVVLFNTGLLPLYRKHGYTDHVSQLTFTDLQKYFDFLRKRVKKEETEKLVQKNIQQTACATGAVNAVLPVKKKYSPQERKEYGVKMRALRDQKDKLSKDVCNR